MAWWLTGIAGTFASSFAGTALSPTLLIHNPLLLVALNPALQHLILICSVVDPTAFFLIAGLRLFVVDPFYYLLGRELGVDAIGWAERQWRRIGHVSRWCMRVFNRAGPVILFLAPLGLISLLAGVARMPAPRFLVLNVLGTVLYLAVVWWFGGAVAEPMTLVRSFVAEHMLLLTLGTALLVLVELVRRYRRAKRESYRRAASLIERQP